jgi:hypothetical protein
MGIPLGSHLKAMPHPVVLIVFVIVIKMDLAD